MLAVGELVGVELKAKQKKYVLFIIIISLIYIAGFRYGLESDYWHYYNVFIGTEKPQALEIGYRLLNSIIYFISHSYFIFCLTLASLSIGIKGRLFLNYKYCFVILLVYYLRFFLMFELNTVRQGLALGFSMAALIALQKNKIKEFVVLCIVGATFHTSTLIVLTAYFINKIKINYRIVTIIFIVSIAFRLYLFDSVIQRLNFLIPIVLKSSNSLVRGLGYVVNSGDKMTSVTLLSFARMIIPVYCFMYLTKKYEDNLLIKCYFVATVINIVLSGLDTVPYRLATEFYCVDGFLLNDILMEHRMFNKGKINIAMFMVIAILILDGTTFFNLLNGSDLLVPYRSIFST